ncbi:cysteine-rich receptor-like protein kinase 42 [Momordica charantia]|uniref:Cysteine-rich receptor-like protein kinase 42 n=1 Tax=Momordica charantia TaxID=3673 RepID=A0A6J1DD30_MOMCH|nr:cysteine-rich receptor-like protein kinase 42 [Momordica charantia]
MRNKIEWRQTIYRRRGENFLVKNMSFIHFSNQAQSYGVSFFFFFFFFFFSVSLSDPRISESGTYCGTSKAPPKSRFIPTFIAEMEAMSELLTTRNWTTHFVNSTPPMFALSQCFHDLSHTDCLLCYAASRTTLPRCLPALSARIFLDGCFLRYDNYSFYKESTDPIADSLNCTSGVGEIVDGTQRVGFVRNVGLSVGAVTRAAMADGGFGIGEVNGVYALAQCWGSVEPAGCRDCLDKARRSIRNCLPSTEGRAMNAGCYLRYSTVKFYNDGQEQPDDDDDGFSGRRAVVAIVLASAASLIISLSAVFACYTRISKFKKEKKKQSLIPTSFKDSNLNFKYETLEKATDYFNPSSKIGQGGAGSVYKGTLPNGQIVAVKRLVFHTRQWVDEFFNEVNLIRGIQHKNLVTLLGCSIEGPESLLVYEYITNRSLDHFIFDKNKVQILNWKQRFDIIVGAAEGLAHLHEGCKIRIIHRDIKSSNVLLDENFTPKIADFGLARHFAADQTHLSTGIAGTLGYMAPEYLVRGQLTEKADVYSFGVLILEIVCGRRNSSFVENSTPLLQAVWELYKSGRIAEAIDPCLNNDFPAREAMDVLQIGLLCTQAQASLRPSMVAIAKLLTSEGEREVEIPKQPPFLNPCGPSRRSCRISSLVSHAVSKLEISSATSTTDSGSSSNLPSRSGDFADLNSN